MVRNLNAIILTANDLPTMKLDVGTNRHIRGPVKLPPIVDGFLHAWDGTRPEEHITVKYWLFQNVRNVQTAADEWRHFIASAAIEINGRIDSAYQPEPNAAEVIGDATWRVAGEPDIWFVKNNVLVYVMGNSPSVNQLKLTRTVARKIEAKINAALNQQ